MEGAAKSPGLPPKARDKRPKLAKRLPSDLEGVDDFVDAGAIERSDDEYDPEAEAARAARKGELEDDDDLDDEDLEGGRSRRGGGGGSGGGGGGSGPRSAGGARTARDAPSQMEKLKEFIQELGGGDLEGWLAVVKTRNAGNSQGQNDVYFRAPTGRQFRSRNEVAKYLGLQGAAPAKGKAKAGKMVTETPTAAAVLPAAPPQMSMQDAASRAAARAADLQARVVMPHVTAYGAVVLNLGSLRAEKAFVAPARLHPVGFQARWTYRPVASSPEAAAAGSPKTLPVFECEVTAQGSLPQYNVYLKDAASDGGRLLLASSSSGPDPVWSGVKHTQDQAATKAAAERSATEAALAKLPSLQQVWGTGAFGLGDVDILALLEAQPAAAECAALGYTFVEQRGGWDEQRRSLEAAHARAEGRPEPGKRRKSSTGTDGAAKRPRSASKAAAEPADSGTTESD